jgi:hypothetical protein
MDASPPSEWHSAPSPPPPATPDERRERPQPGNANVPVLVGGIAAELAATTRAAAAALAAAAIATARGDAMATTTTTRAATLERAAAVLRDAAAERWESDHKLDALSLSLVSLNALHEALSLSRDASDAAEAAHVAATTIAAKEKSEENAAETEARVVEVERLRAALDEKKKTVARLEASFAAAVSRAERAGVSVRAPGSGSDSMPDGADATYQASLRLGRAAAVEELTGNLACALDAFTRSTILLLFLLSEGTRFARTGERDSDDDQRASGGGGGAMLMFEGRERVARFTCAIAGRLSACADAAAVANARARKVLGSAPDEAVAAT